MFTKSSFEPPHLFPIVLNGERADGLHYYDTEFFHWKKILHFLHTFQPLHN